VRRKAHLEDHHVLITISLPPPFFFFFFSLSYALAHSAKEEKQTHKRQKEKQEKQTPRIRNKKGRAKTIAQKLTKSIKLFSFLNLVTRTRIRGSEPKYPKKKKKSQSKSDRQTRQSCDGAATKRADEEESFTTLSLLFDDTTNVRTS
jgi:hypothetical protein